LGTARYCLNRLHQSIPSVAELRQHLANAWRFSFRMIGAGLVCLLHGLLPFLFCTKASDTIGELHDRMITNRRLLARTPPFASEPRRAA
jgi:hypothetical protein